MPRIEPPIFRTPPTRILIIKPSAIGDVVHALPILNLLRLKWPTAHIAWLVTPACAGLLEGHPQLDEIILFDRKKLGRSWRSPRAAVQLFQFHRALRNHRFDLVIDLQGLFRSGWLAWKTGAPFRIGSSDAREFSDRFCTHLAPQNAAPRHAIERYLSVAEFLGLGRSPVKFVFPTDASDHRAVSAMLPGNEPFAVLLPGTNWATKRWPIGHFAALVKPLKERYGLNTVVAGGPADAALGNAIHGASNLAGKTTLRQLVALLDRASLVIANDTGGMHIAAALGKPLVTMFGPTDPIRTGPYGRLDTVIKVDIPCSPCFSRRCSHQSCLRWLGIEPVLAAAGRAFDDGYSSAAVAESLMRS